MSRGRKKAFKHNNLSTIKCATEGCGHLIKRRIVEEREAREDIRPIYCYSCDRGKGRRERKIANRMKKELRESGVKVMNMGDDTIA